MKLGRMEFALTMLRQNAPSWPRLRSTATSSVSLCPQEFTHLPPKLVCNEVEKVRKGQKMDL